MRKHWIFAIIIMACYSCSSPKDDVTKAARKFGEAMDRHDFDEAAKYVSKVYRPEFEMLKEKRSKEKPVTNRPEIAYTIKEQDEKNARVFCSFKSSDTGIGVDVYLSKYGKEWLIDNVSFSTADIK